MLGSEDPEFTRTCSLAQRDSQFSPPVPSVIYIVSWLRWELLLACRHNQVKPWEAALFVAKSSLSGSREAIKEKTLSHSEELGEKLQSSR